MRLLKQVKEFLKYLLPPPIHSFNREVERILAAVARNSWKTDELQELVAAQENSLKQLHHQLDIERERRVQLENTLDKFLQDQAKNLAVLSQSLEKFAAGMQKKTEGQLDQIIHNQMQMDSEIHKTNTIIQQALQTSAQELREIPQIKGQLQSIRTETLRLLPQPRLSYFVLNILDHCNLRCKGCDHFACIAEERYVSLVDIQRDVQRMSELMHGSVTRIGVMGGEPLLHPDLLKILVVTRAAFPHTLIQLVTNGLLLLRQSEEFWTCCHENNITIVNTKYPINLDYDRIQQTASEHHVKFEFYGKTGEVQKTSYKMPMDIKGKQDPKKSFLTCYHANSLPLLMEGKLYPCTVAPNSVHFNKRFGTAMEIESGDFIDIHQAQSAEEVFAFLSKPKPFCRYCITSKRSFGHKWERSKQQMSEWTLEGGK